LANSPSLKMQKKFEVGAVEISGVFEAFVMLTVKIML
jgi:hypothetical protein